MHVRPIMYKLHVESDVNGKFNASLDILHYDCEIAIPLNFIFEGIA
jgi:hypothetical protein